MRNIILCPNCGSDRIYSGREGSFDVILVPLHCNGCGHNWCKEHPRDSSVSTTKEVKE